MTTLWLLTVAAAIEAITGIALMVSPQIVSQLLLGADLAGAGIAVARVAGAALLALGVSCWKSREGADNAPALAAMLTYNALVTVYLIYLGVGGELVGILLWPAIALHAALTLLFVRACMDSQRPKKSRPNVG